MRKRLLVFALMACLVCGLYATKRCKRAVGRCIVANGTVVNYETCTQICCGKELFDRENSFSECCGDKSFGQLYNPDTENCCKWPPALDFKIYNKTNDTEPRCCGLDLIDNEQDPHVQCCGSWTNKPEMFNTLTSMCCQGRVSFITTTAYAECCHDVAFDRRHASCPCGNGKLVLAQRHETECCRFGNAQSNWNPYIKETQGCCDGQGYQRKTEICCHGIIADATTQYCCNGLLTDHAPGNEGNVNVGCCSIEGRDQVYDASTHTCCRGALVDRDAEGDSCCNGKPYFEETGNCCGDIVFDRETEGDGCCAGNPFDGRNGVCCGGGVVGTDLTWPGCCVTQSFDAYDQTCCGSTVYENPLAENGETSHHTRCCGDFGNPSTLRPYDYDSQACCNGVNVSLTDEDGQKIHPSDMECCGTKALNRLTDLCCNGMVNSNPYKEFGRCDGTSTYDLRLFIFCQEGVRLDNSFGADAICCGPNVFNGAEFADTQCCGASSMDADSFKCCDGEQRALQGVPKSKAVCCGDSCVDGRDYWCCQGKAYWKGENNEDVGELVEGMACGEFFKQSVRDRAATSVVGGVRRRIAVSTTTTTTTTTTEAPATPRATTPRGRVQGGGQRGRGRGRRRRGRGRGG